MGDVTRVSWHARMRYCERRELRYIKNIDNARLGKGREEDHQIVRKIDGIILHTINDKALCIKGLTKNNKNKALFLYDDLLFVVKYNRGKGIVVTVMLDHP